MRRQFAASLGQQVRKGTRAGSVLRSCPPFNPASESNQIARLKGEGMFAECSNPDCRVPFDYREGRLIAFCKPPMDSRFPAGHHGVEHFWLCESCSELYASEYELGAGMKIKRRERELREN